MSQNMIKVILFNPFKCLPIFLPVYSVVRFHFFIVTFLVTGEFGFGLDYFELVSVLFLR